MKLYRGTINVTVLVAAEDEEDAIDLVQQHAQDEVVHCLNNLTINEIRELGHIPFEWRDCLVYHRGKEELLPGDVLKGGDEEYE